MCVGMVGVGCVFGLVLKVELESESDSVCEEFYSSVYFV